MKNFWTQIKNPFFALAPMAGITDQPFRLICKEFGVDVLYSEMISSEAIYHSKYRAKSQQLKALYKTLKLIQFSKIERPYVVQIFGADPDHMALAAEYIASGQWQKDYLKIENCKLKIESIPSGIDINMGCPAKDVVKTGAGAALLKNLKLTEKIIKSIKSKIKNIPISIKTRIGWNDNKDILKFLRMLECCGVDAIAIHGRTYKQGFSGAVDWETIYKIKKQLKIPVMGNGGIKMNNELRIMNYAQKLDGVMIGSGALGRPWIFNYLKSQNANLKNKGLLHDGYKNFDFIKKTVLRHAKLTEKLKGRQGIIEFRKHLGWYFRGFPDAKAIRSKLMYISNFGDIEKLLNGNIKE